MMGQTNYFYKYFKLKMNVKIVDSIKTVQNIRIKRLGMKKILRNGY